MKKLLKDCAKQLVRDFVKNRSDSFSACSLFYEMLYYPSIMEEYPSFSYKHVSQSLVSLCEEGFLEKVNIHYPGKGNLFCVKGTKLKFDLPLTSQDKDIIRRYIPLKKKALLEYIKSLETEMKK